MTSSDDRQAALARGRCRAKPWHALACVAQLAWAAPAMAVADSAQFDIPAQPLPAALKAFAAQAHMQLLYPYEVVAGAQANPVSGDLDKHAALAQLLRNTGLEVIYSSESAATIRRKRPPAPPAPTGQNGRQLPDAAPILLAQSGVTGIRDTAASEAPPAQTASLSDVVVTATRVKRRGFTAPTPTTTFSPADLSNTATSDIADALNEMPALRPSNTPQTSVHNTTLIGGNYLDLRGMGAANTLVLVNGERFVPTTSSGLIDTNVIPKALVDHVDVVTGGASADWGSDAVAGVVNIVLKDHLEGFSGEFQGTESTYGDDGGYFGSLAFGTGFADGRGHLSIAGEFSGSQGAGPLDGRSWASQGYGLIGNTAYKPGNGQPVNLIASDVHAVNATTGGVIVSPGPLANIQFGPGGVPQPFVLGANAGSSYMIGGSGANYSALASLDPPLYRQNVFLKTSYDITPNLRAFVDVSFANAESDFDLHPTDYLGSITINSGNAFLPSSLQSIMTADDIASFKMGRINADLPPLQPDSDTHTTRIVAGFNGNFADTWTWSAHYEYGQTRYSAAVFDNIINSNFSNALDAVAGPSGQIVCKSTLTHPDNGCAPLNLFGVASPSAAAINYIEGTESELVHLSENDAAADIQGEPFSLWAGPVSVAAGVEYRRETLEQSVDAISNAGGFVEGNPKPINGAYDVKEGFLETVVPLLRDLPLVKSLELNAAGRVTDYSNNGTVATWKLGATWSLDPQLRLRVTRSEDIRAPDLSELYTQYLLTFGTVIDPASGKQVQIREPSQGNPDLKPEIANTTTAGVIYQPSWLKGFNLSVDVFDIDVNGIVGTLSAQQIVNDCALGSQDQCALITRDSGVITSVLRAQQNISELKTSGADFEADYPLRLPDALGPLQGSLDLRLLGTYTGELTTIAQGVSIDQAGAVGSGILGLPHWRWTASGTYVHGPFQLFVQWLYIGGGNVDNTLGANGYYPNHVSDQSLWNTTATYQLVNRDEHNLEVYFSVHNLLNAAPPIDPSSFIFQYQTNPSLYDVIGRTFTAGVRFHY